MSPAANVFVGASSAGRGTRGGLYRKSVTDGDWQHQFAGLPEDTQVQAITVHPADSQRIYLGTHSGPFRSVDAGDSWEAIPLPEPGLQVWSVMVHPERPETLFAGTSPVAIFRSDDDGRSWCRLSIEAPGETVKMEFPGRVMRLAIDPANPGELYATLEVGGVIRSMDGGETWGSCSAGLIELAKRPHLKSMLQSDTDIEGMMDGHALCVSAAQPGTVFLAVRMGLFRSANRGVNWEDMEVGRFSPLTYSRDVRVSPQDPRVLYACLSPAARSEDGSLYRSNDLGETWRRIDHDVKAEATLMAVALHSEDPDQVHCVSRCGQLFSTLDGGGTWVEYRLPEGVRDAYAVACT